MIYTKIDKRIVGERIANLKILFSSLILDPAAELVYLFGSRAINTAGPLSDYDIAVYFSDMPDHHLKYYLGHPAVRFCAKTGTNSGVQKYTRS
jgi:predicted nucleotidyltransferase